MQIGIVRERRGGELRVAGSPETVKRYRGLGLEPVVEAGAGEGAAVSDRSFTDAGATLGSDGSAWAADIVLKVQRPTEAEMERLRPGQVLIGMLGPLQPPRAGVGLCQGGGERVRARAVAADDAGAGDGRALEPGQSGRLQGAGGRDGGLCAGAADDDDRGRHGDARQGVHRRGRGGGAAGDRDRAADGGGGDRDRRATGGARGDREPGGEVRGLRAGGCRDQGRLCPRADGRGAGGAGAAGGGASQDAGHRGDHGADPGAERRGS